MDSSKHDQAYENVPIHDHDEEEALSNTEVDETSLMGDEKHSAGRWQATRPNGRKSIARSMFSRWKKLLDTSLLVIIAVLLVLVLRAQQAQMLAKRPDAAAPAAATGAAYSGNATISQMQVGGDYAGVGPIFPTTIVKWDYDEEFTPMNASKFTDEKTLAKWNSIMPKGTGWSPDSGRKTFFTTTMTHQLHCVYMMGRLFSRVLDNNTSGLPEDWDFHFMHCIEYLRQSVMCAGDMSMEAHDPKDLDSKNELTDGGWSGHHVCKDYSQVTTYLEQQIKDGVRTVLPIDD